ncbi:alpha-xylosidase [Flagellimonas sp. HMM57]|uniref:glycoside hydrolase family 31 protein n=1 Tax=unclassified Flagellimonas TaxID=2644544 RepID=UPI0013D19D52|nr:MULTISPECIES: alpha-xylosidase [unclassified Flagellimonas]UII75354.1 alpha-xylosidase [Flagellimonas sp. HMM57]
MRIYIKQISATVIIAIISILSVNAQIPGYKLVNEPVDISSDFFDFQNTYYFADSLASFDPKTGIGEINYKRHEYKTRIAFNNMLGVLKPVTPNEFPDAEYPASPNKAFALEFVSDRAVRLKVYSGVDATPDESSLMLVNGTVPKAKPWKYTYKSGEHTYASKHAKLVISVYPWKVSLYDNKGKLLTSTSHHVDHAENTYTPVMPFSFVQRATDYSRSFNAAFSLSPNEKIYGCGESYTEFNKRGSKVVLFSDDANGVQNESNYKPIPFFMSSRGYGMFMHTSSPITCDFGRYFSGVNALMVGDETLDLFIFIGDPKEVLNEYTDLTGKAQMPPLWSFGFWMSRISYASEEEGRAVAKNLRKHKIPSDVIHFDTNWFEEDWRCDYKFSENRFDDSEGMIADFDKDGFKTCLWQLPYFVPHNKLFDEIVGNGLHVKNGKGNVPYNDAVLDFSNPKTVEWYQGKIGRLLELGVGAIKVDFGEAAPYTGIYASGKTGFYEHNLYPLRYNKAVAEITQEIKGEQIMWARSAWAGSQRYPVHWGGDPANTNTAMAATLRGGLSIGLSGFSFWSHDIGGFVHPCPEDLYRRWTPFGMLTSHTRSHGFPPTEPWEYGEPFLSQFRNAANMRYQLMPYIYAQAKKCTETGLPMMRALFVEFPDDPGTWLVDDEYLFGEDILVAPLFEEIKERSIYLPEGKWIDYQTGKVYDKGWHTITAGEIPVVMLVRDNTIIPHIKLAQSTKFMDWSKIDLKVYSTGGANSNGDICLPEDDKLIEISATKSENSWTLNKNGVNTKFKIIQ